jgi:hypothetical protein
MLLYEYIGDRLTVKGCNMFSMDDESKKFLQEKIAENQYLRIFFGGYG